MRNFVVILFSCFSFIHSFAVTKTVTNNSGQGWAVASTWSPAGVPADGDVVIIPAGFVLPVKGAQYSGVENLSIVIYGTLEFEPSGKLDLGAGSIIQIMTSSSSIVTNGTGSEVVQIGGLTKYTGKVDGTLQGPLIASSGTGISPSGFVVGVLPVKLIHFTAEKDGQAVVLDWQTALEENAAYFAVERRSDASPWERIGTVAARGEAAIYGFRDALPLAGNSYYRLLMADLSGHNELSRVVTVHQEKMYNIRVGPNPLSSAVEVWFPRIVKSALTLCLFNTGGQLIRRQTFKAPPSGRLQWIVSGMAPGTYFLAVNSGAVLVGSLPVQIK